MILILKHAPQYRRHQPSSDHTMYCGRARAGGRLRVIRLGGVRDADQFVDFFPAQSLFFDQ